MQTTRPSDFVFDFEAVARVLFEVYLHGKKANPLSPPALWRTRRAAKQPVALFSYSFSVGSLIRARTMQHAEANAHTL